MNHKIRYNDSVALITVSEENVSSLEEAFKENVTHIFKVEIGTAYKNTY